MPSVRRASQAALLALLASSGVADCAPAVSTAGARLEATGAPGAWTGVALRTGDQVVAAIRLGAGGRWTTREALADGGRLTFRGFDTAATGGTPALGPGSYIRFALDSEAHCPRVEFRLDLLSFDPAAWAAAWDAPCPLHFLDCTLDRPEFYYFHGLLAPTPRVDPYPFSWRDMRANWADGWSTAPSIGALTVPAVGFWRPSNGRLVAYCFQEPRSTDRSDRDLAVAYCWGGEDQAFSLVWPRQRGFNELTYPTAPCTVATRFEVLQDLATGPTADLNRLVFDHLWEAHRDTLPTVPGMNDLGWMVPREGFEEGAPSPAIFQRVPKSGGSFGSMFFQDNTEIFGGSFRAVDLAFRRHDEAVLEQLRREVDTMLSRAIWETIDGEECVYWRYPSEGGWEEWIGGTQADTTHNVQQFGFAGALLAAYLHEPSDRLWRHVEGCWNWSRHYVYTRGDICDIPCSMFTLQTSQLALNFLLNLHYSLADDPDPRKREIAQDAFALAVTVVWRNANATTADPDPADALDPTFLMPGNHARFWLGQVSWAELCDVFRSMIVMYAETGDPRFKYYVRGALDKWWMGFESDGYHTAENLDVFGETAGPGTRTGLHGPQDSFWEWAQPVGDTLLHVTAGRGGAIAFCKGTTALDVADYRFRAPSGFAFRIEGSHEGPFRMVFSSPFRGLSGLPVTVNGEPASGLSVAGAQGEHLFLTVEAGATVEIGHAGEAPVLEPGPIPTHPANLHRPLPVGDEFRCLDLGPHCNTPASRSWEDRQSWAGLSAGLAWGCGAPYLVTDPDANEGRMAVSGASVPIDRRVEGLVVVASRLQRNDIRVELSSGASAPLDPEQGVVVRTGRFMRNWELVAYPYLPPANVAVHAVQVRPGALLFAVTLAPVRRAEVERLVRQADAAAQAHFAAAGRAAAREASLEAFRERVRAQQAAKGAVRAAFLPPHGEAATRIRAALDELGIPSVALRPEEFVDPAQFSVADYPIAVHTGPETYLRTVQAEGDGERTLLEYLRRGGTLLVLGPCRPFTYPLDLSLGEANTPPTETRLFGREFGLDLLGPGEERGGAAGFEQAPPGDLSFRLEPEQRVLTGLEGPIRFPATGDRRYRPAADDRVPEGDEFEPLLTLYDDAGKRYGPAVSLLRRHAPGAGGNVLHVWGTLLSRDFPQSEAVLYSVLAKAAELCSPASLQTAAAPAPVTAAVGILPLTDGDRAALVRRLCGELGQGCAEVGPDALVDRARFSAERVPIALHAPQVEGYVDTWRLPGDGSEAYTRYVREGGFLVAAGNATQFWYAHTWEGEGWRLRSPLEPRMLQAIGLPIEYGFERPAGRLFLEPVPGAPLGLPRLDVTALSDPRWRALMPTRGADIEFTPLAYLTDENGRRYDGYAAALIHHRRPQGRPGAVLYLWGNLLDGEFAEPVLRAALRYAFDTVQEPAR